MAELPLRSLLDRPADMPPLGYLLRQAAAAHRLRMERALADIGVTPPQFLVLTMLRQYPGSSNADLARLTSLSTPTMTVIIANLKRRGAVRSRPHPVHRRIQRLYLSDLGTTLLAEGRQRAVVVEAELMAGSTAADLRVIGAWLKATVDISGHPELDMAAAQP